MTNEAEPTTQEKGSAGRGREHVTEVFAELGLDLEKVDQSIVRKLVLLDEKTETFRDEERAVGLARALFAYYERTKPGKRFNETEQRAVLIGSLLSDIGKTGPRDATAKEEMLILDIYAVEGVIDIEKTTFGEFMRMHFPGSADDNLAMLGQLGLDTGMSMREFYNLHPQWTLDIIEVGGIPPEAVAAAALHHILENVNPDGIVGPTGRFTKYFGENVSFDRIEKLIIILDKYDAARRRGGKNHHEAIALVRGKIESNSRFADDAEFSELVDDLNVLLSSNTAAYRAEGTKKEGRGQS